MTLATALTLARILAAPICTWALIAGESLWAAGLIVLAAVTDYLDGALARRRDEVTPFGTALDPIADKVLTLCVLVGLAVNGTLAGLSLGAALAILIRETIVSGLREAGAGQLSLPVTPLAKIKTAAQFAALVALAFGPSALGIGLLWFAAALTVYTGIGYIRAFASNG